jgi:hypothetical protein
MQYAVCHFKPADRHFSASRKAEAERYASDPAHRAAIRGEKKAHER